MPIWMVELAKWLGLTKDSTRPNWGVALLVLAGVLYAVGVKESDIAAFGGGVLGIAQAVLAALTKFATSPENQIGSVLGGIGLLQLRGKNKLTTEQHRLLESLLAAERVRRELANGKPKLELDG